MTILIKLQVKKKVVGYCGYFKLINGFEKTVYWTRDEVEAHRIKHNKMSDKKALNNVWKSDYDAMAMKTVLRNMLGKWGILSIELQKAFSEDETRAIKDITEDANEIEVIEAAPEEAQKPIAQESLDIEFDDEQ
ncbi:recombinase RecT [Cytobacillus horneckiae]|nr:recombinase RecT [Cytobacillus horneckiae]